MNKIINYICRKVACSHKAVTSQEAQRFVRLCVTHSKYSHCEIDSYLRLSIHYICSGGSRIKQSSRVLSSRVVGVGLPERFSTKYTLDICCTRIFVAFRKNRAEHYFHSYLFKEIYTFMSNILVATNLARNNKQLIMNLCKFYLQIFAVDGQRRCSGHS